LPRSHHDRQSRFSQRLNQRTSCVATADFFNTIGQKQTFCAAANNDLFDHVGSGEDRLWDGEAQRLGGF
jgi:hypothetical protein